ncbi:MAG: nucleoside deaminase [Planctomycetes bacterium]|nr:nucleoside deaminase [Planctomycetota bacterium]NOG55450.1 nucleoside deaminase [Planctomycetota bacterium]
MELAIEQALKSRGEGGIPIGAVLVDGAGQVVAAGHNQRVQTGDPTAHAEVDCVRNAGRRGDWHRLTLYSTLSPCPMCSGTAVLFKIPQVVVGENRNFVGAEQWMRDNGIVVTVLDDQRCVEIMKLFIERERALWYEDIAVAEEG